MITPASVFSFFVATFLGAAFHFWKGGSGGRLILYLVISWIGFMIGNWLGTSRDIPFLMIGPISGGFGSLGSLVLLFFTSWIIQLDEK
jgi:hypothetical protein